MSEDQLDEYITKILAKHQHADRTKSDVINALKVYKDLTLKFGTHVFEDGKKQGMAYLDGFIPVRHDGAIHNISVTIWLHATYPHYAPVCYVKASPDMHIKASHHLDKNGKVHLPCLHYWNQKKYNLLGLIRTIITILRETPPKYAEVKVPDSSNSPSSLHHVQESSTCIQVPMGSVCDSSNSAIDMWAFCSYPLTGLEGTSEATAISATPSQMECETENFNILASFLSNVGDKLKQRLQEVLVQSQAKIEVLKKKQSILINGKSKLEYMLKNIQNDQLELEQNIDILMKRDEEISDLLSNVKIQDLNNDDNVVATAHFYCQLLHTFATINATKYAMFYLAEALRKGDISLDLFLKMARQVHISNIPQPVTDSSGIKFAPNKKPKVMLSVGNPSLSLEEPMSFPFLNPPGQSQSSAAQLSHQSASLPAVTISSQAAVRKRQHSAFTNASPTAAKRTCPTSVSSEPAIVKEKWDSEKKLAKENKNSSNTYKAGKELLDPFDSDTGCVAKENSNIEQIKKDLTSTGKKVKTWECEACMVMNPARKSRCIACDTPRISSNTTDVNIFAGFKFNYPAHGGADRFRFGSLVPNPVSSTGSSTFSCSVPLEQHSIATTGPVTTLSATATGGFRFNPQALMTSNNSGGFKFGDASLTPTGAFFKPETISASNFTPTSCTNTTENSDTKQRKTLFNFATSSGITSFKIPCTTNTSSSNSSSGGLQSNLPTRFQFGQKTEDTVNNSSIPSSVQTPTNVSESTAPGAKSFATVFKFQEIKASSAIDNSPWASSNFSFGGSPKSEVKNSQPGFSMACTASGVTTQAVPQFALGATKQEPSNDTSSSVALSSPVKFGTASTLTPSITDGAFGIPSPNFYQTAPNSFTFGTGLFAKPICQTGFDAFFQNQTSTASGQSFSSSMTKTNATNQSVNSIIPTANFGKQPEQNQTTQGAFLFGAPFSQASVFRFGNTQDGPQQKRHATSPASSDGGFNFSFPQQYAMNNAGFNPNTPTNFNFGTAQTGVPVFQFCATTKSTASQDTGPRRYKKAIRRGAQ